MTSGTVVLNASGVAQLPGGPFDPPPVALLTPVVDNGEFPIAGRIHLAITDGILFAASNAGAADADVVVNFLIL